MTLALRRSAAVLTLTLVAALGACTSGDSTSKDAEVSAKAAQTVDDIGASGAWWVNDLVKFPPATRDKVAELLFGESGLHLSAYRYNIGGGGVGVTDRVRAAQTFQVAPGRYDWSQDPGGRMFLQYAAKYQVPDLIGFVNSAPPAFTSNQNSCGGLLAEGSEDRYGTYVADVVTHLAAQGMKLTYLSPMNEPTSNFNSCGQEGMAVPVEQRGTVVRAVGKALAAKAPYARVIADEANSLVGDFNVATEVWLGQPDTAQYVAKLAHHTYDNPDDVAMGDARKVGERFHKPLWATEICCFAGIGTGWGQQYDPTITSGLALADIFYKDFAVIGDSAFHWWVALSAGIGCDPHKHPGCEKEVTSGWNDGLVYYDPYYATNGNHTLYLTKRYYALGQYSRFVRPGAVRHDIKRLPSGVQGLAFLRDGQWTLVLTNLNKSATAVTLNVQKARTLHPAGAYRTSATEDLASVAGPTVSGTSVSATLPGQSITTYLLK